MRETCNGIIVILTALKQGKGVCSKPTRMMRISWLCFVVECLIACERAANIVVVVVVINDDDDDDDTIETWLILPVVIRLSKRLSHACLSISESETANGSLYQL
jgi:hypothetical protein